MRRHILACLAIVAIGALYGVVVSGTSLVLGPAVMPVEYTTTAAIPLAHCAEQIVVTLALIEDSTFTLPAAAVGAVCNFVLTANFDSVFSGADGATFWNATGGANDKAQCLDVGVGVDTYGCWMSFIRIDTTHWTCISTHGNVSWTD